MERGNWVAVALLGLISAGAIARWLNAEDSADRESITWPAALLLVGRTTLAWPLFWLVATWIVASIKMTLVGSWGSEGRVFLAPYYYYNFFVWYLPWAVGGIVVLAGSRLVASRHVNNRQDG